MKKLIKFPSIEQFRNVVYRVNRDSTFIGLDKEDRPIYDEAVRRPILRFTGSVKLHGTNAGVCYNNIDGLYFQSRSRVITQESDNAGFAFFANSREEVFKSMMNFISLKENVDLDRYTISIFGEWAGKGIQKDVAISELDRAFFIFGVRITSIEDNAFYRWLPIEKYNLSHIKSGIFNINSFQTFSINIDFNNPELIQNKLIEITKEVEAKCPIADAFGIQGIGEGVVWSTPYGSDILRFKVKGELHSSSRVKTLANIDVDKINSIEEFVEYSVTENRFNQAVGEIYGEGELDIKKLGNLIKWIRNDIIKEETDTMSKNNLFPKDIGGRIGVKVKEMFKSKL